MKVAFFSTVLNHHQVQFCDEMYRIYGDEFIFVSTMDLEEQRVVLNYQDYERSYKLKMNQSAEKYREAELLFQKADVVIMGVAPIAWLKKRMSNQKLTFIYQERFYKKKPTLLSFLRYESSFLRTYWQYRRGPTYLLCASAYVLHDYKIHGLFQNKAYSWGYFPPFVEQNEEALLNNKPKEYISVFWAGRLVRWKNPQYVVEVASSLKKLGIAFHIDIAGTGIEEDNLKKEIEMKNLSSDVTMIGVLSPQEIRTKMENSHLYLFTSNREEGFGAVLPEAMNSGCAVVASDTAGATRLLVSDGVNGMIYHNDSVSELCKIVCDIAVSKEKIEKLGISAYRTIKNTSNPIIAAERFSVIADGLLNNKIIENYTFGPMSKMR